MTDVLARIGGGEFGAILSDRDRDAAHDLTMDLIAQIRDVSADGLVSSVSVSVGVALTPERAQIASADLLAYADSAMYAAKRAGRGMQIPPLQLSCGEFAQVQPEEAAIELLAPDAAFMRVRGGRAVIGRVSRFRGRRW